MTTKSRQTLDRRTRVPSVAEERGRGEAVPLEDDVGFEPGGNPTQRTDVRAVLKATAALYGSIAFLVFALIAVCFLVAWLATGRPY
jgi:hypothetical protein